MAGHAAGGKVQWEVYQRGQTFSVRPRGIILKNPPLPLKSPATLSFKHKLSESLSLPHPDKSQRGITPSVTHTHTNIVHTHTHTL